MNTIQISANDSKSGRTVVADFTLGENLNELIEQFGEEVVFSSAKSSIVIDVQAVMRRQMRSEVPDEQIAAYVANWRPGVKAARVAVDPFRAALMNFTKKSPEEQKAFLEELRELARTGK